MKNSSYKTIQQSADATIKEKGSSFIGEAYPISSVEEFQHLLSGSKKKYYDATHHCYAFRLASGYEKYSDDGEPSGSAGVRIMNALVYHQLIDVAIIVIRYFGGTKLGVGPLGIAYSQAAMACLAEAKVIERHAYIPLEITVSFEQTHQIYHLFSGFRIKIKNTVFTEEVVYHILLVQDEKEKFVSALDDQLRGRYKLNISDKAEFL